MKTENFSISNSESTSLSANPKSNSIAKSLIIATVIVYMIGALFSCMSEESSSVDQNRIYTTYEVFYDSNTDITYARAQFRLGNIGGTTLKLTAPAEVKFNDEVLTFNETLAYYEKQFPGYLNGGEFKYKDTGDKIYINAITNLLRPSIPESFTTVDRSKANTFTWAGGALGNNESIILDLFNTGQTNFQLFTQSSVSSVNIILPISQLANIASGNNNTTAVLDWSRTDALTQGTSAGGYIKATSRDKSKIISVTN